MIFNVRLGYFSSVMGRMFVVAACQLSVMSSRLMFAGFVVLGGFFVMSCRMFMVLRCFMMMVHCIH